MAHPAPHDWPHRAQSRSVATAGHSWWVIDTGTRDDPRPTIVMLHGAGGSGHSFRHLIPLLDDYRLIVPDLPGQGLTQVRPGAKFGLEQMTQDLIALCKTMDIAPDWIIGHSAGGALALHMAEKTQLSGVIGINAALSKFDGAAGVLFPLLARFLAAVPLVPQAISALWGNPATVERLLSSTGSQIDAEGRAQYLALVRRAAHVNGTLSMMAAWDLDWFLARLPQIATPVLLIAAADDGTVPARVSQDAAARLPRAELEKMAQGGHLVHEVDAPTVAARILLFLQKTAA
jgi:magnesium chelatase accessory protein